MRLALFGSPIFALPSLEALHKHHELVLVVTQPDKPVGRGMKFQSPPAAQWAKDHGIRLEQPKRLKNNPEFHETLKSLDLEVVITAAYGKILPKTLLEVPKHGFLNVHASLLPKYRGAAPIQWALINGESETGISIMQTEEGLDTGPVRFVSKYQIQPNDTAVDLFEKLATLGAEALTVALEKLELGTLPLNPQENTLASFAPLLEKEDGLIRWDDSANSVYNRYRGVIAWPGSWTHFQGKVLKVLEMSLGKGSGKAGQIIQIDKTGIELATAKGSIKLITVQAPNKSKMSAYDWANGYAVKVGDDLG